LRRLVATADVLLETQAPGRLAALGLGYEALAESRPGLIVCSLTPFGQTGPWRDYRTSDLLHMAAGGQMASCGYEPEDVPDAPPIAPGGGNAWHIGSHFALVGICAALSHRDATGEGQHLDVSVHEACAMTTEGSVPIYLSTGRVVRRQTGRHSAWSMSRPRTQYRCADGKYVNAMFNMRLKPQRLRVLAEWLDEYDAAEDLLDEAYADPQVVLERQPHIADVLRAFFPRITAEEAYRGSQQRGFAWGPVRTPDELLADPHWTERGFWVEVEHEERGERFRYPGAFGIYGESPVGVRRRAPRIGEHNVDVYRELGVDDAERARLTEAGVI
jgi:benzylsuccinate CoA-transferase BbsE subunit